mgnify:FL=1
MLYYRENKLGFRSSSLLCTYILKICSCKRESGYNIVSSESVYFVIVFKEIQLLLKQRKLLISKFSDCHFRL